MWTAVLDELRVLLTGIEAAIARGIVRLTVAEGASVMAADGDAASPPGSTATWVYFARVETAHVNLANQDEVKLWEGSLRAFDRLPHLLICGCNAPVCWPEPAMPSAWRRQTSAASDVALSEWNRARLSGAGRQRGSAADAVPARRTAAPPGLQSARSRCFAPSHAPGVLDRSPGGGAFDPDTAIPYVRTASHPYSIRRQIDGDTAPQGRIRLTPAPARVARRAEQALTLGRTSHHHPHLHRDALGSGQVVKLTEDFGDYSVSRELRPGENARLVVSPFKSVTVEEIPVVQVHALTPANESRRITAFPGPRVLERRFG